MNVLYFDQQQLWQPDIAECEDNEAAQAVSVNKLHLQYGRQLTIEVALALGHEQKFEVMIGEESTMQDLHRKILAAYEIRNPSIRGVKGLRITELFKQRAAPYQGNGPLWQAKFTETDKLPKKGKVGNFIQDGNTLLFTFDTAELLVKVTVCLIEAQNTVQTELELIVDKQMLFKDFQLVLQKMACRIWNQSIPVINQQKNHVDEDRDFGNNSRTQSHRTRVPTDKKLMAMDYDEAKNLYVLTQLKTSLVPKFEDVTIGDVINYKENELVVCCEFESLYKYFTRQASEEAQMISDIEVIFKRSDNITALLTAHHPKTPRQGLESTRSQKGNLKTANGMSQALLEDESEDVTLIKTIFQRRKEFEDQWPKLFETIDESGKRKQFQNALIGRVLLPSQKPMKKQHQTLDLKQSIVGSEDEDGDSLTSPRVSSQQQVIMAKTFAATNNFENLMAQNPTNGNQQFEDLMGNSPTAAAAAANSAAYDSYQNANPSSLQPNSTLFDAGQHQKSSSFTKKFQNQFSDVDSLGNDSQVDSVRPTVIGVDGNKTKKHGQETQSMIRFTTDNVNQNDNGESVQSSGTGLNFITPIMFFVKLPDFLISDLQFGSLKEPPIRKFEFITDDQQGVIGVLNGRNLENPYQVIRRTVPLRLLEPHGMNAETKINIFFASLTVSMIIMTIIIVTVN